MTWKYPLLLLITVKIAMNGLFFIAFFFIFSRLWLWSFMYYHIPAVCYKIWRFATGIFSSESLVMNTTPMEWDILRFWLNTWFFYLSFLSNDDILSFWLNKRFATLVSYPMEWDILSFWLNKWFVTLVSYTKIACCNVIHQHKCSESFPWITL